MTRLIGAVLLFLASVSLGWIRASARLRRPRLLFSLADALDVLKTETCLHLLPMPEALRCAARATVSAEPFFHRLYEHTGQSESFETIWSSALSELTDLDAGDLLCLRRLGERLGRVDIETQRTAIESCVSELRERAGESAREAKTSGRLSKCTGFAFGTLLAITLY